MRRVNLASCLLALAIGCCCFHQSSAFWDAIGTFFENMLPGPAGQVIHGIYSGAEAIFQAVVPGSAIAIKAGNALLGNIIKPAQRLQSLHEFRENLGNVRLAAQSYEADPQNSQKLQRLLSVAKSVRLQEQVANLEKPLQLATAPNAETQRLEAARVTRMQTRARLAMARLSGDAPSTSRALQSLGYAMRLTDGNVKSDVAQLSKLQQMQKAARMTSRLTSLDSVTAEKEMTHLSADEKQELFGEGAVARLSDKAYETVSLFGQTLDSLGKWLSHGRLAVNSNASSPEVWNATGNASELCRVAAALDGHFGDLEQSLLQTRSRMEATSSFAEINKVISSEIHGAIRRRSQAMQRFREATGIEVTTILENVNLKAVNCFNAIQAFLSNVAKATIENVFELDVLRMKSKRQDKIDLKNRLLDRTIGAGACLGHLRHAISNGDDQSNVFAELRGEFERTFPQPGSWRSKQAVRFMRGLPDLVTALQEQTSALLGWQAVGEGIFAMLSRIELLGAGNATKGLPEVDEEDLQQKRIEIAEAIQSSFETSLRPCPVQLHVREAIANGRIVCDNDPLRSMTESTCGKLNEKRAAGQQRKRELSSTQQTLNCLPKPQYEMGTFCQFNCFSEATGQSTTTGRTFEAFACGMGGDWSYEVKLSDVRECNKQASGIDQILAEYYARANVNVDSGMLRD